MWVADEPSAFAPAFTILRRLGIPVLEMPLRVFILLAVAATAQVDFSLECSKGYRVSSIKRAKTYYSVLGSLTVECEQIARPDQTTCVNQQSIPKCTGLLEGCGGESWLGGLHAFLLENTTQAVVLDPVCCSSPSVHVNPNSCIHDQLNAAKKDFSHSLVADLTYRGIQCWHQYDTNHTLVDLLWKMEICPFESDDFPIVLNDVDCDSCDCECGIQQCANGVEPVRVIHKKRIGRCGCECDCTFKCIDFRK